MEEEIKTNSELSKKKGSNPVVLILACLLAFAAGFAFTYFIGNDKGKDKKSNSNEVSNKVESNNEVSEDVKKDISKKLAILFGDQDYEYGSTIEGIDAISFASEIFKNSTDEKIRTRIILNSMKPYKTKKLTAKDISLTKHDPDPLDILHPDQEYGFYSREEFTKLYESIYNVKPTYVELLDCPQFYYDSISKDYVSISACGFGSVITTYVYIDSYEYNNDDIDVTVYVGAKREFGDTIYYKDYEYEYPEDENASTTSKFESITKDNKDNFTKHTITFGLANNNYYLKKAS